MLNPIRSRRCRGGSSILAVFFVSLFSVLSISYVGMTNVNVQMSANHRDMVQTQAAAESGLGHAQTLFERYLADEEPSIFTSQFTDAEVVEVFAGFADYVQWSLDDTAAVSYATVGPAVAFNEGGLTGLEFSIPAVMVSGTDRHGFTLVYKQYTDTPREVEVASEGADGDLRRRVRLNYTIAEDTNVLELAMMSKSRIIITGDSTVGGDIFSTWMGTDLAAPFELASESGVDGTLSVTVDETDWDGAEVEGDFEEILYNQPQIGGFDADDFDTTYFLDLTTSLKPKDSIGQVTEYFPHAAGDYTQPADADSAKALRKVFEGQTYTDRQISAGSDALFKDCIFEGVLYVGSAGNGKGTNNIRFENCTFRGPIITNVPESFTAETSKKNVLYFTGDTRFDNTSDFQNVTILAPNYNVNIGDTHSFDDGTQSTITGLLVGGVVDIRGNANVEGTILSIGDPNVMLNGEEMASNLGYSDENSESSYFGNAGTINITPSPDQMLPIGVRIRTLMFRDAESYVEL